MNEPQPIHRAPARYIRELVFELREGHLWAVPYEDGLDGVVKIADERAWFEPIGDEL